MRKLMTRKAQATMYVLPEFVRDDWQSRLVGLYRQGRAEERQGLALKLAARIQMLTGQRVDYERIVVDTAQRQAQVVVDGVKFRLGAEGLVLVRTCAICGSGQFESPTIITPQDIGYALSDWHPHHVGCHDEDPPYWLED